MRLNKHGSHEDQPVNQLLSKCAHLVHIIDLIRLPGTDASTAEIINM